MDAETNHAKAIVDTYERQLKSAGVEYSPSHVEVLRDILNGTPDDRLARLVDDRPFNYTLLRKIARDEGLSAQFSSIRSNLEWRTDGASESDGAALRIYKDLLSYRKKKTKMTILIEKYLVHQGVIPEPTD